MNVKVKPLFVASISAAVLFATMSHASAEIKKSDYQLSINQEYSYELSTIKLNNDNLLVSYQLSRPSATAKHSPFIKLASKEVAEYMPMTSSNKGNQLFELATLFNDKLQQILAFFQAKPEFKIDTSSKKQQNKETCHTSTLRT